jgi:hypothetical protein
MSTRLVPFVLVVATFASCKALNKPIDFNKVRRPERVPARLDEVREDLAAGDTERALYRIRGARSAPGLPTAVRDELETLLEEVVDVRIRELSGDDGDPRELAQMIDLGLPNQSAVTAGVLGARAYMERGKEYKAYKLLSKLEERYPRHHGKVEAGAILAEAGLILADDPFSFLGFFAARKDGMEVLEYLILTYPADRRCDEAYFKLAEMYEEDRLWVLARQRHEDLRLWHAESPYAILSEAMIPRLRLRALKSPEYERRELLKARFEIENWLRIHADHAIEPDVRLDYADCLERLILNDLSVARFYRRVEQYFGARLHAERALVDARVAGNPGLIETAEALLITLPDDSESRTPDASAFSADESLIRTTIGERKKREAGEEAEGEAEIEEQP